MHVPHVTCTEYMHSTTTCFLHIVGCVRQTAYTSDQEDGHSGHSQTTLEFAGASQSQRDA